MTKIGIRKYWNASLELIIAKRELLLPFIIIAFFELLALEFLFFVPRKPLAFIFAPIIRKFFGEAYLHYPGNILLLSKLFYYVHVAIYVSIGVLFMAVATNMIKNMKANLPLNPRALIKNASRNYGAFFLFGALMVFLVFLLRKGNVFLIGKFLDAVSMQFPNAAIKFRPFMLSGTLFITNVILQTFFISAVPLIVLKKMTLVKALRRSAYLGFRNFFTLFGTILAPLLVYFIINVLRNFSIKFGTYTFPELVIMAIIAEIVFTIFVDCFVVTCVTHFVINKEGTA